VFGVARIVANINLSLCEGATMQENELTAYEAPQRIDTFEALDVLGAAEGAGMGSWVDPAPHYYALIGRAPD
jgi:hypothetical protein